MTWLYQHGASGQMVSLQGAIVDVGISFQIIARCSPTRRGRRDRIKKQDPRTVKRQLDLYWMYYSGKKLQVESFVVIYARMHSWNIFERNFRRSMRASIAHNMTTFNADFIAITLLGT